MSRELIDLLLQTIAINDTMTYLKQISAYDRYQASQGIELAASLVADIAHALGIKDVSVERFPANGKPQWWSFQAPVSWTPTKARLEIFSGNRSVLEIDHDQQPFSLATYSAPTCLNGNVSARLVNIREFNTQEMSLEGAVTVIERSEFIPHLLLPELIARGVIGFVTDASCCGAWPETEYPGRIELDPNTPLFGFSVTSRQLDLIRSYAKTGAHARVIVKIDRSASMPIVTGILPGNNPDGEIWLTAHLCHPRPGANDNASGVAALLGVAASLVALREAKIFQGATRTIRFLWGPEFLGTAAFLYQRMTLLGKAGLPYAVINLDMVGEDQMLCGCPFIVEHNPDFQRSLIGPIAEHVTHQVFARTNADYGMWRSAPFMGFSDHALFADPNIGCPAIQFCHAPDRFNHSAGDTLDKVSSIEMLRSVTAGAALAQMMAMDGVISHTELENILRGWCARQSSTAHQIALQYRSLDNGDWARHFLHYTDKKNADMLSLIDSSINANISISEKSLNQGSGNKAVLRQWNGPINIRAMIAALPSKSQSAVFNLIRADKLNYALLTNFAIRVDGNKAQDDIIKETSFALQRPVAKEIGERLFGAFIESGWVIEAPKK